MMEKIEVFRGSLYIIKYEDGRKYTVCGTVAFVQINKLSKEIVEEAGNMMKIQHEKLIEG